MRLSLLPLSPPVKSYLIPIIVVLILFTSGLGASALLGRARSGFFVSGAGESSGEMIAALPEPTVYAFIFGLVILILCLIVRRFHPSKSLRD